MNKQLIFIFLELFTIRHLRDYKKSCIYNVRNFIKRQLFETDNYQAFRHCCILSGSLLSHDEYLFVSNFLDYLKVVDKLF